jgi:hypothetical protein
MTDHGGGGGGGDTFINIIISSIVPVNISGEDDDGEENSLEEMMMERKILGNIRLNLSMRKLQGKKSWPSNTPFYSALCLPKRHV